MTGVLLFCCALFHSVSMCIGFTLGTLTCDILVNFFNKLTFKCERVY